MSGYEKYLHALVEASRTVIIKDVEEHAEDYAEIYKNHLLGLNGRKVLDKKFTRKEIFFYKIFDGFSEIAESYESLRDVEIYVGRFPYGNTTISRLRHLRHHIENYLNEVYILKERSTSYLTIVGRLYRNDPNHATVLRQTRPLFTLITETLDNIVRARGAHVHQLRYTNKDLSRLGTFELLAIHGGEEMKKVRSLYELLYKEIRNKYKSTVKDNNTAIKEVLDFYFERLFEVVFDTNLRMNYPSTYK